MVSTILITVTFTLMAVCWGAVAYAYVMYPDDPELRLLHYKRPADHLFNLSLVTCLAALVLRFVT